jgi:putative DNA primase/helicase
MKTDSNSPSDLLLEFTQIEPWAEPVDGSALLTALAELIKRFVVLPQWAPETLALWTLHTYAFHLRDVSTYIGVESPEKRCGKTTLLGILSELVSRPIVAANISSPAFFRVIEETQPTLLIDEADTLLRGNDELRGILNSGYTRKTAYVVRVATLNNIDDLNPVGTRSTASDSPSDGETVGARWGERPREPLCERFPRVAVPRAGSTPVRVGQRLVRFSCWCPKVMAAIGRLPDTLADRCIVIRMQRKTHQEQCERLRNVDTQSLRQQCARFVLDHASQITSATPAIPPTLHDRAADIWEPLFVLADLAGGSWPDLARQAAISFTAGSPENNSIGSLMLDIIAVFAQNDADRMFSRDIVADLNSIQGRPWADMLNGKPMTELWLAQQLRPYGVRPKTMWIRDTSAKGYVHDTFIGIFRRYITRADFELMKAELAPPKEDSEPGGASVPASRSA